MPSTASLQPSPEDVAKATAWIDAWPERDPTLCPVWFADNRSHLIGSQSRTFMIERMRREAREAKAEFPVHPPKQHQPRRAA